MVDLGNTSFVLGIKIHQDRSRSILELSQKGYIDKVLKRFGMQSCKPIDTLSLKETNLVLVNALKVIWKFRQ